MSEPLSGRLETLERMRRHENLKFFGPVAVFLILFACFL